MSDSNPGEGRSSTKEDKKSMKNRIYGDTCGPKKKGIIRFMFQNVNGLGYSHESVKSIGVRNTMYNNEVDIMCMAETNLNWSKLRRTQSLQQLARRWYQTSKTVVSYNQHQRKSSSKHQPGGTAVMCKGEMALRAIAPMYDTRRLGRWASQAYQGKNGMVTRVVSVYVPIVARKHGHKKVFCQQQKALLHMGIKDNVITLFWNDFWTQIDKWLEKGEQLVIGGDWNCKVTDEKFIAPFKDRELLPINSTRHGPNLPPTHNNGSYAIDEIFASKTLDIRGSGFLPHGSNLSDHCPVWIDITKDSFIGVKDKLKPTYATRKLKTNDPRVVTRYINHMKDYLSKTRLIERTEKLFGTVNGALTETQQLEFEEIDKIRIEAMKFSEKNCRKLKMGEICWSPKVQRVRDKILYLSLSRRRKLNRKVSAKILLRLSKRTKINAAELSVKELNEVIDQTYKEYRILKKDHRKHRDDFLNELADALQKAGKGKKSTIVKQLIAIENQRAMFRKLAAVYNKTKDLSTKTVTVTSESGSKVITEKMELEDAIINENREKYHQTEDTCPFLTQPLQSHFGRLGKGPSTEEALEGNYNIPTNQTDQTKKYIELCRMPQSELIINPMTRSLDYFCKSWKKMREQTSSRDTHFGHYKAALEHDPIMTMHYQLAEIPFRSGYAPQRWKEATNVMILKKEGNTNLDKLRTLVLFESDFNHNNKFLGRQMMHHLGDRKFLAKEQYSTPGKKCIDHVVNRKLYFDLIRYQKSSAAMAGVDLKSCYDRVAHAPAYLAMRSYGIPSEPIESMFSTIQDMQYFTFTAHGMSKKSFGGIEKGFSAAPNGLGQGNGAGPSVWSVVSSKMFQVMHHRNAATKIVSPLTNTSVDVCGFAFVDDTDLIAMSPQGCNDHTDANKRMQTVVNEWEAVSKTTGGALVPSKCWSWIMSFKWNKDRSEYDTQEGTMTVKDAKDNTLPMEILPPHQAKEMLGVRLAPDGNHKEQFNSLKKKMKQLSEFIRVGHVNRYEAWTSLTMMSLKSLEYSIPAMTFSKEEYRQIMTPVLKYFLPQAGINRNIARDILYAPLTTQGFNLKDPYLTQGTEHIKDITEHLWKDTLTGQLLQCNMEQLRIEMGTNDSIFEANYNLFKPFLLTKSFVTNSWEFMTNHEITLEDKTATIPMLREGDKCIMKAFMTNTSIPTASLKTLNKCRMYLKVFSLADITTGTGNKIRNEAWHGRRFNTGRENSSSWPNWGRPSLQAWTYWRTALKLTFCTEKDKILTQKLSNWFMIPKHWQWFVVNRNNESLLIERREAKEIEFKKIGRSKLLSRYNSKMFKTYCPKEGDILIPTTVVETHNTFLMDPTSSSILSTELKDNAIASTTWLNVSPYKTGSESKLANALKNGLATAVSDGSYSEKRGIATASWILSTVDKKCSLTAGCVSPGQPEIQSSYRAEILGLLGIIERLYLLCNKWNINKGACTIFCDGISALEMVENAKRDSINTRMASCDLLSACAALKERIPITLHFQHVKGHQDSTVRFSELSFPSQLNVLMDNLAKETLRTSPDSIGHNLPGHHLGLKLPRHNNNICYQKFKTTLYNNIMNKTAHTYWIEDKQRYKIEDIPIIDWKSQHKALTSLGGNRQRTLSKWFSGWLGTGTNMQRWNLRYSGNCPFCGAEKEDTNHVLRCSHTVATKNFKSCMKEYDKKLTKYKTAYPLRKAIILELHAWRENRKPPSLQFADSELKTIILQQRRLGWKLFLEGIVVKGIGQYQEEHLERHQPKYKTMAWQKKVILASWNLLMEIWTFRNETLHEPKTLEVLQGKEKLEETIIKEWEKGLGSLPTLEFSHLFRIKKEELTKKSIEGKKDWLATIKLGRKLHNDISDALDIFDTNNALRFWIGLPKNVKNSRTTRNSQE